jgi:hypothetical protein
LLSTTLGAKRKPATIDWLRFTDLQWNAIDSAELSAGFPPSVESAKRSYPVVRYAAVTIATAISATHALPRRIGIPCASHPRGRPPRKNREREGKASLRAALVVSRSDRSDLSIATNTYLAAAFGDDLLQRVKSPQVLAQRVPEHDCQAQASQIDNQRDGKPTGRCLTRERRCYCGGHEKRLREDVEREPVREDLLLVPPVLPDDLRPALRDQAQGWLIFTTGLRLRAAALALRVADVHTAADARREGLPGQRISTSFLPSRSDYNSQSELAPIATSAGDVRFTGRRARGSAG